MQTNQTPEELAEEISRLFEAHIDAEDPDVALHYLQQAHNAINSLRDMAASRAKDAERYQMVRRGQRWSVINGIGDELKGEALDAAADAAIAATKRGGA